jgi:endonuclease III
VLRGKLSVLGGGMVIDLDVLLQEEEELSSRGIEVKSNIRISENAHLILPYHKLIEEQEEKRRGKQAIGTTLRGIGPAYEDKAARRGLRVGDLRDRQSLTDRLHDAIAFKNELLKKVYTARGVDPDKVYHDLVTLHDHFADNICDTSLIVQEALDAKKNVLFEGAHGTLLDIDWGTYPYVTSSNPLSGEVTAGGGISPKLIDRIIGAAKAYTSRVGAGPFPTAVDETTAEKMREPGGEFGSTTGRARGIGWSTRSLSASGTSAAAVRSPTSQIRSLTWHGVSQSTRRCRDGRAIRHRQRASPICRTTRGDTSSGSASWLGRRSRTCWWAVSVSSRSSASLAASPGQARLPLILRQLNRAYGRPSHARGGDPLDSLIGTVLSQNTTDVNSHRAFERLKERFPTWDGVLAARPGRIATAIRSGGLGEIKSKRIKQILREIEREHGKLDLSSLKRMGVPEARDYLTGLPGVGPKTAACVLLFSLGKPAFPVDTHVLRVSKRLGLLLPETTMERAHEAFEVMLNSAGPDTKEKWRAGDMLALHLGLVRHGREICSARRPRCEICPLRDLCPQIGVGMSRLGREERR